MDITLRKPFDGHVHLRQGAMLEAVAPSTASRFSRAIVMPNTDPPVWTVAQALEYRHEILASCQGDALTKGFEPLMTLYLTKELSATEIEKTPGSGVYGVKYYPWGATTNSQWGYRNILEAKDVLTVMERVGLPLLLHGEVHLDENDAHVDPYQGEQTFIRDVLPRLLDTYPTLKVSLEHLSSSEGVDFVEKHGKANHFVATIPAHHLLYTHQDIEKTPILRSKPLVKNREDREKIRGLVAKGYPFIFAGTDSAPHSEEKKRAGAFGVFSAPIAIELYTQVFHELGALEKLEDFLSINGPRFYGVEPSGDSITLEKQDWTFTESFSTAEGEKIKPLYLNETLHWKMKN